MKSSGAWIYRAHRFSTFLISTEKKYMTSGCKFSSIVCSTKIVLAENMFILSQEKVFFLITLKKFFIKSLYFILLLRTNVTAVLKFLGTLFFDPSFFCLNQWFRAKVIWKTHQSRSQRSKRAFFEFSKKISEKSWVFSEKEKIAQK